MEAHILVEALRIAARESARLRGVLDAADEDGDAGRNAAATLRAAARAAEGCLRGGDAARVCAVAAAAGERLGEGHVGVLLAAFLRAWSEAAGARQALGRASQVRECCGWPSPALIDVLDEAGREIAQAGPDVDDGTVIARYCAAAQWALVDGVWKDSRLDAAATAVVVLCTAWEEAATGDATVTQTMRQMLVDLARTSAQPRRARRGRFTVDFAVEGDRCLARAALERVRGLTRHWIVSGCADAFGAGRWRLHARLDRPTRVLPAGPGVYGVVVRDGRPARSLGADALSERAEALSIRLLERPSAGRPEDVCVVACTRAPGLVEELAQSGAAVLVDPSARDAQRIVDLTRVRTTPVALVVPCDAAARDVADRARRIGEDADVRVDVAGARDELQARAVVLATAGGFVPAPGGVPVAPMLGGLLSAAGGAALARARTVVVPDEAGARAVGEAVRELVDAGARESLTLLVTDRTPEGLPDLAREAAAQAGLDLTAMRGGGPGPSLLGAGL